MNHWQKPKWYPAPAPCWFCSLISKAYEKAGPSAPTFPSWFLVHHWPVLLRQWFYKYLLVLSSSRANKWIPQDTPNSQLPSFFPLSQNVAFFFFFLHQLHNFLPGFPTPSHLSCRNMCTHTNTGRHALPRCHLLDASRPDASLPARSFSTFTLTLHHLGSLPPALCQALAIPSWTPLPFLPLTVSPKQKQFHKHPDLVFAILYLFFKSTF